MCGKKAWKAGKLWKTNLKFINLFLYRFNILIKCILSFKKKNISVCSEPT